MKCPQCGNQVDQSKYHSAGDDNPYCSLKCLVRSLIEIEIESDTIPLRELTETNLHQYRSIISMI